eukprot:15485767-Alexandrium_andersonii.AAC.1
MKSYFYGSGGAKHTTTNAHSDFEQSNIIYTCFNQFRAVSGTLALRSFAQVPAASDGLGLCQMLPEVMRKPF